MNDAEDEICESLALGAFCVRSFASVAKLNELCILYCIIKYKGVMVRIDFKLIKNLGLSLNTNKKYYITYDTHTYVYLYIGTSLYEAIEHSLDFTIEEYNNGDELSKGIVTELTVWKLLAIITNDIKISRFKNPDDLFTCCVFDCSNSLPPQYPSSESSMEESDWEIDRDNYIEVDEELFLHPERLDDISFPNDLQEQNQPNPQTTMTRYLQVLMAFCVSLLVCIIIVCVS